MWSSEQPLAVLAGLASGSEWEKARGADNNPTAFNARHLRLLRYPDIKILEWACSPMDEKKVQLHGNRLGDIKKATGRMAKAQKQTLYVGSGLEVKESKIPNAGRGLFSTVDIPAGACITEYHSAQLSAAAISVLRRCDSPLLSYMVTAVSQHDQHLACLHPVDGYGGAQFANRSKTGNAKRVVLSAGVHNVPVIMARVGIAAGEEITYNYGNGATARHHAAAAEEQKVEVRELDRVSFLWSNQAVQNISPAMMSRFLPMPIQYLHRGAHVAAMPAPVA